MEGHGVVNDAMRLMVVALSSQVMDVSQLLRLQGKAVAVLRPRPAGVHQDSFAMDGVSYRQGSFDRRFKDGGRRLPHQE